MSEYMARHDLHGDVTVLGDPDPGGFLPVIVPSGHYALVVAKNLSPLPSPDDEVEVVVRMLRGAVERIAEKGRVDSDDEVDLIDACRDHMEAEG